MDSLVAAILGIVQGLTEYLPVSSSGHLVLGRELLGVEEPDLFFDIMVHVATLLVTVIFYRRAIGEMARETAADVRERIGGATGDRPLARLSWFILLGTIPTGLIGVVFKDTLESLFDAPRAACAMLLVTAAVLVGTRFTPPTGRDDREMTWKDALVIGTVQGLAIVPGISRSGSTIAAALFLGLDRELAARFSFLLSVPAILGALVLKLKDVGETGLAVDGGAAAVGFVAALVTGFAALVALLPLVRRGRLHWFAFYLVPTGLAGLMLLP